MAVFYSNFHINRNFCSDISSQFQTFGNILTFFEKSFLLFLRISLLCIFSCRGSLSKLSQFTLSLLAWKIECISSFFDFFFTFSVWLNEKMFRLQSSLLQYFCMKDNLSASVHSVFESVKSFFEHSFFIHFYIMKEIIFITSFNLRK